MKKILLSAVVIFVVWFALDFVIHGVLLADLYQQTANLWRPMAEIQSHWWMHLVSLACAFIFTWLWCCNTPDSCKSVKCGLSFGAKIGLLYGLSMGLGMYCVMPIPLSLGLSWLGASVVSYTVAGAIAGYFIKECKCPTKKAAK